MPVLVNQENKDLYALFCRVEVFPITQSFQLHDEKQSSQSSEKIPGAKQTPQVHKN